MWLQLQCCRIVLCFCVVCWFFVVYAALLLLFFFYSLQQTQWQNIGLWPIHLTCTTVDKSDNGPIIQNYDKHLQNMHTDSQINSNTNKQLENYIYYQQKDIWPLSHASVWLQVTCVYHLKYILHRSYQFSFVKIGL